ncbi:glycoside-pentoside-hexuronide (GPH):cation symporter [Demequina soli]|uniref:glycoside-pentoside-hexuronide (GPH):cation symporter n=1 Tax=Demequina soli TaxID=1638987 RepID=UPI000784AF9E|nr:glycoside-pentoside-hexuronide (GPH):cation symporter [Demequina soli]
MAAAPQTATSPASPDTGTRILLREKLSYASGDIGANLIYAPTTTFVLFYLSTVVGIGAAVAGTILLVGQLLNGITDLTIGVLIDKTKTRWGKARPWVLGSAVPLALSFWALFSIPGGLSDTGKVIWAFVAYSLVMAVFFTSSNVAYGALMSLLTPNPRTRITLTSFRFFAALLTTLVVNAALLPVVGALGNNQGAWTTVTGVLAIVSVGTMLVVFFGTKERVTEAAESHAKPSQPTSTMLRNLMRNRYFFLAALLFIAFNLTTAMSAAGGVFYADTVLGDPNLFGPMNAVGLVPALIGLPFMPALMGRFGKRRLFLIGITVMIVGSSLPLIDPTSFPIVVSGLVLRGIGMVPLTAGMYAIVADVADFAEWKDGNRSDGLIFSSVTLGQKIGAGFGAAIVGWTLAAGGFVDGAAQQSDAGIHAVVVAFVYLPLVAVIITGIAAWFLDVERHVPAARQALATRNQDAADGEITE